jgi:hypothetical protein
MNRVQTIVRTGAVTLERFDHELGVAHHDPDREQVAGHAVSFVEAGPFRRRKRDAHHPSRS